jgi:hypothetical protein
VNCIAINGKSNRNATVSRMSLSLLFFIIINFLISLTLLATVLYTLLAAAYFLFNLLLFEISKLRHHYNG